MWGLAAYLTQNGYDTETIRQASSQWLHFIRPDYYVAVALEKQGADPEQQGVSSASSCYEGRCDTPFYTSTDKGYLGGCGGMGDLIPVEEG